ncbi:toll-like receptor 8 [Xyrauchen texanus]|uniref:toll-like receptor 8 n=1 Tax=Xyrauchen texanus TaxID=154827 RepID=UPI0022420CBC|nr:toll-like receptor 8 [Xyrauchen texanus]XP_051999081.1 toll-like receptor 8 [Xyrauchen texanus]
MHHHALLILCLSAVNLTPGLKIDIATMVSLSYWFTFAGLLIMTLKITLIMCQKDMRTMKAKLCDVHENVTTQTREVDCHGLGLRAMPFFTKNTTSINLSENKINNLTFGDFKDLKNLTDLNLNWMNMNREVIVAVGVFSNLTKLQTLLLSGMALSYVPKELPKSLRELKLVENKIISLNATTFLHVKNLTSLYLSKNCYYWKPCLRDYYIENGSFSMLANLQHLTLSYNNLTHVPRGLPATLQKLELASNRIAHIGEHDFQGLSNLISLNIQGNCPRCYNAPYPCVSCKKNAIVIHPEAFANLGELQILNLAGNSIIQILPDWFRSISKLEELYLSYNFLSKAVAEHGFLSNLPLLKKLDLSFNYDLQSYPDTVKLSPSFSNLTSLKTLHIQGLVFQEIRADSFRSLYGLQNLSVLDVGINFIVHAKSNIFEKLQNLKLLYLSENRLYPVTVDKHVITDSGEDLKSSFAMPSMSEPHQMEHSYEIPKNLVKPECYAMGRVLDLSRNNLFFISPKQFEGYGNISCLNLSGNGFAAAPNGTEFTLLPGLKYLDLSFNKIDLAYDYAFTELQSLEVLDLSYNPHYFTVSGVTHNLNFLKHLPSLKVLNMSYNSINTLTTKAMSSQSLQELQFQYNSLGKLWREKDKTYDKLFQNLTNLTYLDISYNLIDKIPLRVYTYLPETIQKLRLSHNTLTNVNWTSLRRFKDLRELILSNNNILSISSSLSKDLPSLQFLDLRNNSISELSIGFLNGAVNLGALDLSHNRLITINQSTFPSENERYLKTLWLNENPFHCTCDLLEFVLWIYNTNVKIPKLVTSVKCDMPEERHDKPVIDFDIKECIDDQLAFLAYFFSTVIILCTTIVAVAMHMFYWDVSYIFYYLKARFTGYQYLSSNSCVYDAFVTYDTKDPQVSDWVLNHLRVQLEDQGEGFLPICLEERDWIPGSPVLDSLNQSIQHSRKTVFVLTKGYVNSGSFKLAVFLAHQRLLEDNEDVIVLLLLEPVLQHSQFLRLRRQLCSRSILEWPHSPSAESWFWQSLRNAIRVDNQAMYSDLYSRYFTTK